MTTPTPAEAFAVRRDLYLVERLRRTYNDWNNPPSYGLPDGADVLLDAADTIERLVKECEGVVAVANLNDEQRHALDVENVRLRSELEAAREALASVLPPTHGIHGGPLVGLRAVYEDGTDESSARHRGWIAHGTIEAARAALTTTVSQYEAAMTEMAAISQTAPDTLTPPAVPEGWQPIETAPKGDNYIRVWSWGRERHAQWNDDRYSKRPRPFWDMDGMSVSSCRSHQPKFWMPTAAAPSAPEVDRG